MIGGMQATSQITILVYFVVSKLFFFLFFLVVLGLRCHVQAFSSCGKWWLLFIAVHGLLTAVTSLVAEHRL